MFPLLVLVLLLSELGVIEPRELGFWHLVVVRYVTGVTEVESTCIEELPEISDCGKFSNDTAGKEFGGSCVFVTVC